MRCKLRKIICAVLCCGVMAASCAAQAAGGKVPVLMYHDLTDDAAATNSMTITAERFRWDMEFLQQFGYTALLPADLIDIQSGAREMPDKPVMITFDDGYRSNYDYAYPTLQQTGMKAVISVVAYNMQPSSFASDDRHSLTWDEIYEMANSGIIEIGSHTYNLHNPQYGGNGAPDGVNGVMRLRGETQSAYNARVGADLTNALTMIRQYTGQQTVNYFSYPFGAYDAWMEQLLNQNGVRVSTLTNGAVADISNGLHRLPRYRIMMDNPVSSLLRQSERAAPALARVSVNGAEASLPAYNINGNNYVRVRDVAKLLAGTTSEFSVNWNSEAGRVELISFSAYTPRGNELAPLPAGSKQVQSVTEPTVADYQASMVAAFNIDGSTFYKLRSLGDLCGFRVDWDPSSQTVQVTA
ncbi:polysaccharide deacetylase family protein [Agathobaculum sp.]|uniref:polysaccharide deacetylase family protein n=1 Tax=Agathobaculum sp. TaxID=2048138 RepID=UPI002A7FF541|nr:polysaccharide deacetylase family protein [Agathobaculum sp.]MDY3619371.1 polysaccharide deacetylase family protein [Agathobaculum sp.]